MAAAMKPVSIIDGRIFTEAVEINAVWHCNISCQSCSHGSPEMPRDRCADPAKVTEDLRALSNWMRVEHVRVLGGEPLLHPDIVALLAAIRSAGITDTARVLTNGLRLHDQAPAFWDAVDEIHVSVYPNTARQIAARRELIERLAAESGTVLLFKYFDYFRVAFRPDDHDDELTQLIYDTCQIGNSWRCLTVENGTLYRCPQSAPATDRAAITRVSEGIGISGIRDVGELRAWIENPSPLPSCATCAGSAGLRHPHKMRRPVPEFSDRTDLIDHEYLGRLLADPDADNGCVREVAQAETTNAHVRGERREHWAG
jgi:organic radical activating enzyme